MRKITVQALTDVGLKRAHNEDYYGFVDDLGIYVVCDGMGGHASGEVASRMTVEHVVEFVNDHYDDPPESMPYGIPDGATPGETLLSNAIQYANDRVYVEGMKDSKLEGMGTTIVAVLAGPDRLVVGHVGDSRVYCFNPTDRLVQVTRDHSLLNHKIERGELKTAEEIAGFSQGNIIVRAIGLKDYVSPEVQTVVRRPEDIFLLCSDGLTDLVDDWLIENVVEANSETLAEGNTALVRMANDRGGKDNITVMMLRVDDEPTEAAHGADTVTEEVTDPRGIDTVEEVTDPGFVDGDVEVTDESMAAIGFDETAEALDVTGLGCAETQPELPKATPSAAPAKPTVEVQSGAVTARRRKITTTTEPALPATPSVIVDMDETQEELPSFIIDLD